MIQVSVEVSRGVANFTLSVRAQSIQWAIDMVKRSFPDAEEIRVVFPVPPEAFFVRDIGLGSVLWPEVAEEKTG